MNVLVALLFVAFLVVGLVPKNEFALSLDTLCIVDGYDCKRTEDKKTSTKDLQGFYCLSGPDFKKIVNKLKEGDN